MLKSFKLIFAVLIIFTFESFCLSYPAKKNNTESVEVKASLDVNQVETGHLFSYSITIKGKFETHEIKITRPTFDDFKIIHSSRSRSRSIRQDGTPKLKIKEIYGLSALEPGEFVIGPVKVVDGDKTYLSQPVKITVEGDPVEKQEKIPSDIRRGIEI